MKKFLFILSISAVSGLLFSCQKSESSQKESDEGSSRVVLTTNMTSNVVATKAGVDYWNQQNIYVYSFPSGTIPSDPAKMLLNNVEVTAPDNSASPSYLPQDVEIKDASGNYFYYTPDKQTYEFFAYYVGDAVNGTPAPVITEGDKVNLPIVLDGSQDIMIATSDKEADIAKAGAKIAPTDAYSSYSARKNVVPNIVFEHNLSRFVFRVIAGSTVAENIQIDSITLQSNSMADLVIASIGGERGIKNPSVSKNFKLKPIPGGTEITDFVPVYKADPTQFDDSDRIGESIMVIPSGLHHLDVHMTQFTDASKTQKVGDSFAYKYDLTTEMVTTSVSHPDDEFLMGYQYNVNIVIYGQELVVAKVTLSEWGEGGVINIDNDKEWGDEKYGVLAKDGTGDEYYLYFYGGAIAVGKEVKIWDKATNAMVYANPGNYDLVGHSTYSSVTLVQDESGVTTVSVVTPL